MLGHVTAELSSPQWNEGCLCELKPTPAASSSSLAMHTIFGQRYFRKNGRVSRFCPCSVETVQQLNQELIAPLLFPLLNSTYFRYVKLSLERPCPFWDDGHGMCALRDCAVEACSADEERRLDQCGEELGDDQLGDVQRTDVATLGEQAPSWDLAASRWTDQLEVDNDGGAEYVDLVDNPEQYTGYSAAAGASRIWDELHTHNSFAEHDADDARHAAPMAVEQQLFARLLSGLHASVSSHIAIHYLLDRRNGTWGLELDEYARRLGEHR
jgi:ERO1-like protein alpha